MKIIMANPLGFPVLLIRDGANYYGWSYVRNRWNNEYRIELASTLLLSFPEVYSELQ